MKTFFHKSKILLLLIIGILLAQSKIIFAQELNAPEKTYEFMWRSFDANYALFNVRHIDWKALYNIYRPLVNSKTTDDELYSIMSETLSHLNDNHVRLMSTNPRRFFSTGFIFDYYGSSRLDTFRTLMRNRPVPAKYFKEPLKETENKIFAYGLLDEGIGYFHFNAFGDSEGSAKAIDEIIAKFKNAKAIIVDVRRNGGGDDQIGKLLACRFADRKRLYMTTQERNGSKYDDFDPKKYFFVEPKGPLQFTKTVILLTNRLSISAAENFTLAMRILPHVTVVGDFTSGCFADNYGVNLPNGWTTSISKNYFLDYNGFCWEGIGVPPDIKIKDNYDVTVQKSDPILETAISLINSGNLSLQDNNEGIKSTESLVNILAEEIEKDGIKKAIENFNNRNANTNSGNYYLDFYELLSLGGRLFKSGKTMEGEKIFLFTSQLFPDQSVVYDRLGLEYIKQNRNIEAIKTLKKSDSINQIKFSPFLHHFSEYLNDILTLALLTNGFDGMSREYLALKEKYPLHVNERFLNSLGYVFLSNNLYEYSVHVLKLNVEKYPESSNAYDSLGEAYMKSGNKTLAIENYEKSLKINPQNTNAVDKLKKLREK